MEMRPRAQYRKVASTLAQGMKPVSFEARSDKKRTNHQPFMDIREPRRYRTWNEHFY